MRRCSAGVCSLKSDSCTGTFRLSIGPPSCSPLYTAMSKIRWKKFMTSYRRGAGLRGEVKQSGFRSSGKNLSRCRGPWRVISIWPVGQYPPFLLVAAGYLDGRTRRLFVPPRFFTVPDTPALPHGVSGRIHIFLRHLKGCLRCTGSLEAKSGFFQILGVSAPLNLDCTATTGCKGIKATVF